MEEIEESAEVPAPEEEASRPTVPAGRQVMQSGCPSATGRVDESKGRSIAAPPAMSSTGIPALPKGDHRLRDERFAGAFPQSRPGDQGGSRRRNEAMR